MRIYSKLILALFCIGISVLYSCSADNILPDDSAKLKEMTDDWRYLPRHFSIDPTRDTQIVASAGTVLTFPAGSFLYSDGTPVTSGMVMVELIELYKPKDFILNQTSTVTVGERAFISGGQVWINAKASDGRALQSAGYHIAFRQDPERVDPELTMNYFYAVPRGVDGWLRWRSTPSGTEALPRNGDYDGLVPDTMKDFYYIFEALDQFAWINCDQFVPTDDATTGLRAKLDMSGFDLTNSTVVFVMPTINSVVPARSYDASTLTFINGSIEIPEGTSVRVLMFGYQAGILHFAMSDLIPFVPSFEVMLSPQPGTEEELQMLISSL